MSPIKNGMKIFNIGRMLSMHSKVIVLIMCGPFTFSKLTHVYLIYSKISKTNFLKGGLLEDFGINGYRFFALIES